MKGKYFNNKQADSKPIIRNRRDSDKLIESAYKSFMLLGLMALRDEFGFSTVRLWRYIDKMTYLLDSYNHGYISVDDLNKTIEEETGIKII